jgi:RNA polymerase sigma-70 factor (ECF subfamily)
MEKDHLAEAMRKAQQGDALAYRELLEGARAILKVYAGRVLSRMGKREAATIDDVVQDVLLAIHEKRHTYDAAQPFLPWLFAIARYKLIDYGRREKRKPTSVAIEMVESALVAPVFSEPAAASDLETLISGLPEKTKKILELVKLEGLSIAEAAAVTQMSESAVKVTIHRALKALRARTRKEEAR